MHATFPSEIHPHPTMVPRVVVASRAGKIYPLDWIPAELGNMASVQVETNHGAGPNCPHPPWKLYHNPHYSPRDILHLCSSSCSPSPRFSSHGRKSPEPPMIIAPDDEDGRGGGVEVVVELADQGCGYGAMSSELELCVARIRGLRAELDFERRMRRKAEALAAELAEERRRGEAERRALREEAGAARAEAGRVLEDVEEERRMLRVAELWREERVQMKLADARAAMEEKMREVDDAVAGLRATAAAASDNNNKSSSCCSCSSPNAGKSPCSSSQQGQQSPSRGQQHRREPNGGENPHIRRGIKGFVEFPRAVRVRPRDRDRDERVDLVSNLECQRAQLRVLMRHRSPATVGVGLIGAAENLVV